MPTTKKPIANVRLNKTVAYGVTFARKCAEMKIPEREMGQIVQACILRASAWNVNNLKRSDNLMRFIEEQAKAYEYETDWPGLYPVLRKGGYDYYLPLP